jgi:hypothetical protein
LTTLVLTLSVPLKSSGRSVQSLCHVAVNGGQFGRVLAAGGRPGGFSAAGGVTTKLRLLNIEGAQVGDAPTLFESLPLAARPRRG